MYPALSHRAPLPVDAFGKSSLLTLWWLVTVWSSRGLSMVVQNLCWLPRFSCELKSINGACLILHIFITNLCVCVLIIFFLGCLAVENVSTTFCESLPHHNSVLDSWKKEIHGDSNPPLHRTSPYIHGHPGGLLHARVCLEHRIIL